MSASLSNCSPRRLNDLIERLATGRPCVSFGGVAGCRFMNGCLVPSLCIYANHTARRRGEHGSHLGAMRCDGRPFQPHPDLFLLACLPRAAISAR